MKPVLCAAVSSPSELMDKAADYPPAVYKLTVGDVPVAGFWSLTVYNSEGCLQPNPDSVYSVNDTTAKKGPDGSVIVQFGGCKT
jgi:hypothetical protein